MKKILFSFLFTALFSLILPQASALTPTPGQIAADRMTYDFGDIYQEDGKQTAIFSITNLGQEPLSFYKLSTSCGCTVAEMNMDDLEPGEKRTMKVVYDPQVHKDQFGPITRMVYLQSSDNDTPELTLELTANILSGENPKSQTTTEKPTVDLPGDKNVEVYFNESCQDCGELVNNEFPELFKEYGYGMTKFDYINERSARKVLNQKNKEKGIPFELQSHIMAFVNENLIIGGHVPEPIIRYLLENPDKYEKILVYQDDMHGTAKNYKVWDFKGEIKTYPIDEPITTYLTETKVNGDSPALQKTGFWGLFTVITSSAFLDGINPCAIAVLLFFIAFLFTMKRTKKSIWKMGLVYIFAIFLAYFLIGLGLLQAIIISGSPHLMAYIGAYLVITLGVIQLLSIIFPKFPIKLRIPINTKATIEKWIFKGTLPAAFIGGFVVGLCTFPCSGGIYVAIISMLSTSQTYGSGLAWMFWYNLVFILPLVIILFMAGNPLMVEKIQNLERKEAKTVKIIIGLTMIALGLIILKFFVV